MLTLTYSKYGKKNLYNITLNYNDKNKKSIINYNFNNTLYSTKNYTIEFIEDCLKFFNKKNLNLKKADITCSYFSFDENKNNYTNCNYNNNTQHNLILEDISFKEFENIIKNLQ
jgi:uncharacterized cysteine cluster protein YcgN (CxxCxxCC family)